MKQSWAKPGRVVTGVGWILWATAVLSQCATENTRFSVSLFGIGVGMVLIGSWMTRPSRRAVMAGRAVDAAPVTAAWIESPSPIALRRSEFDIRMFEIAIGDTAVLLGGNRVRLGGDQEWRLSVSSRRASIRSRGETLASAARTGGKAFTWMIDDGTRKYWIEKSEDRSVDKAKSAVHAWGKDAHTVTRRRGVLSLSQGGTPVAVIDLEYSVESTMTRKLDGHRDMKGAFGGVIDVRSPVPVPVALLGLRLTLSRWAKSPPKTGEWVFTPPAGG